MKDRLLDILRGSILKLVNNFKYLLIINNKKMKYKKALIGLIAMVLIILISVIVAGMIYSFSVSLVQKQKDEVEGFSIYFDAELFLASELSTSPGSPQSDVINLGVKRKDNEGDVVGVRFIIEDNNGKSYAHDDLNHPPNNIANIEFYDIDLDNLGITSANDITKISLMLLYGNNNPTKVLDILEINS